MDIIYNLKKLIPDKMYIRIQYFKHFHYFPNLKYPKTFNEKLQWLKLYDRRPEYTMMVDKYEVRKYITEKIGEEYLVPLLGVWDSVGDINFTSLPNQFVLKCTHDSGSVIMCRNKVQFNIADAKAKLANALKRNAFYYGREWPYKSVKPRIIGEKYMADELGEELKDYKIMCFNGRAKCSFVCLNRNSTSGLNVDFYDMNWKPMPFERHYPNSGRTIAKPRNFNKMVEIAETLSKGITFLRVDFYEIEGQLYFGELTFFPGSGFEEFTPESYDLLLGRWINLPSAANEQGEG